MKKIVFLKDFRGICRATIFYQIIYLICRTCCRYHLVFHLINELCAIFNFVGRVAALSVCAQILSPFPDVSCMCNGNTDLVSALVQEA